VSVKERGRAERGAECASRGRRTSATDLFRIWTERWQIKTPTSRPSLERNSKVSCQSFPSSEARQGVQYSAKLTTVSEHLLRASQQGLVQPFGVQHRSHRRHCPAWSQLLQCPQTPSWRRRNSRGISGGILTTSGEQGVIGDELVAVGFDDSRDIFVSVENSSIF
jgi:hypothetical protein